jgi:hypothetical protein
LTATVAIAWNLHRRPAESGVATSHHRTSPRGAVSLGAPVLAVVGIFVSAGGAAVQSDRDKPTHRGFGRQVAGGGEGVQAIARKFVGRDVVPDVPGVDGLGQ